MFCGSVGKVYSIRCGLGHTLPLHVRTVICAAALERHDVIDNVTGARSRCGPVEGHGFSRRKARLAAALRRILPWLSRSHDEQVPLRCEAALSRRSERGSDRGFPATADPLMAMQTTKAARNSMPLYRLAGAVLHSGRRTCGSRESRRNPKVGSSPSS
jgi:hypothetical protein